MTLRMELSGSSEYSGPVGEGIGRRTRTGAGAREGLEALAAPPAAALRKGVRAARSSMSWRMIRPLGPLPEISASSRPKSLAMRFANGEARTRPPFSGGDAGSVPPAAGAGPGGGDWGLAGSFISFGAAAGAELLA